MLYYGIVDLRSQIIQQIPRPVRYYKRGTQLTDTLASGTPAGTVSIKEAPDPPTGYLYAIRYFELITPAEVVASIIVVCVDNSELEIIDEQPAGTSEYYEFGDWNSEYLILRKFKLKSRASVDLTADREIVLKWSGGLVKEYVI